MPRIPTTTVAGKSIRPHRRQGAAVIELAVCLPVIFLVAMGAIEATSMTFLRQSLVQASYETIRESVKTDGSQAVGLQLGQQVLNARNIQNFNIAFNPADVDDLDRGTPVTVTATAPGDINTIFPFGPFAGQVITVQATMLKE